MKPFDNKLLRQAINYALDPHVMLKHIYDGHGAVVNGPLGSNWVGFDPNIKRYPYDPKKARELLTKAGYPNGLETKLYLAPDRHLKGREVCEVIADQLGKVGIKAELVPQEYAIYWGKDGVNGGKLPFYYAGRNSTSSSTRNNAPAITRSASRFYIRRDAFSWKTCRSRRCIRSPNFTA
jgi:ABC-type transport system substrate-binding protein